MLEKPNIEQGFIIESYAPNGNYRFYLLDDGIFELSKYEFADAFSLLFSREFIELINLINHREYLDKEMHIAHELAFKNNDALSLFELESIAYEKGMTQQKIETTLDYLIDKSSWNIWIDAVRLYECFTGCSREDVR